MKFGLYLFPRGIIFRGKFVLLIRGLISGGRLIFGGLYSGFYGIWLHFHISTFNQQTKISCTTNTQSYPWIVAKKERSVMVCKNFVPPFLNLPILFLKSSVPPPYFSRDFQMLRKGFFYPLSKCKLPPNIAYTTDKIMLKFIKICYKKEKHHKISNKFASKL